MEKNLIMNKNEFEQDLLKFLQEWGFKIDGVSYVKIECRHDLYPKIEISYIKQYVTVRQAIKNLYHKILRGIKYGF
jgi:hypothetical protein